LRQQFKQEHSADQLMQQYLAEKNAGTLPCNLMAGDYEDHVFTPYKDKVMAPYLEALLSLKQKLYRGFTESMHPNEHLKALGLKHIRFDRMTPLYL
jgi:hypothetical protein